MRPRIHALLLTPLLMLGVGTARAEFSLFGSAGRTPANPFASNYASPPVGAPLARPTRPRRPVAAAAKPPREIPGAGLSRSKLPR